MTRIFIGFPGPYGRAGLLFVAVYLAGAAGLVLAAGLLANRRHWHPAAAPAAVVGIAIGIRLVLAVAVDAPLTGENRIVFGQAASVLDGVCCMGHRPMGYPIALAAAFGTLGIGSAAVEALNIVLAALTTFLIWDIGRVAWGRRVGAIAAMGYAVMPSAVLLALVPLTEPMYTAALAAAVRFGMSPGGRWSAAAATGALLAVAQYVRATAVAALVPFVAVGFLTAMRPSRAALRGALIVASFVLLLVPVVLYNVETHGELSVSTSAYGGWSLYVGANREHDGMWNAEDSARLETFPGESTWDRSAYAGGLGWERYTADLGATLDLFTTKFRVMWGDEKYAAGYALPVTQARGPTRAMWVGWLTSQLAWLCLTALATFGVWVERGARRPVTLLVGMIVMLVALSHLLLEVHGRYHAYLVPLLWLLAAAGMERLLARRAGASGQAADGPLPA